MMNSKRQLQHEKKIRPFNIAAFSGHNSIIDQVPRNDSVVVHSDFNSNVLQMLEELEGQMWNFRKHNNQ